MSEFIAMVFIWLADLIEQIGYPAIAFGTFLETIFPPIPAEAATGFAGYLISQGKLNWFGVLFSATFGNACGVSLFWYLGHTYGNSFFVRFGKYFGISQKSIIKAENMFQKHGYWVVFWSQFIPGMRTFISIPAGMLKTTYWKFLLANQLGATIWFGFTIYLAYLAGENWKEISNILAPYDRLLLSLVVVCIVGCILYFVGKKIYAKNLHNKAFEIGENLDNE